MTPVEQFRELPTGIMWKWLLSAAWVINMPMSMPPRHVRFMLTRQALKRFDDGRSGLPLSVGE